MRTLTSVISFFQVFFTYFTYDTHFICNFPRNLPKKIRFLKIFYLFLFYSYVCLSTMCVECLNKPEGGIRSPGIGVVGSDELSCGCWELSPAVLQERKVFLTAEPYLQPLHIFKITLK